ncbi:MAG: helix-turn-helix transcriptional regulator, partial [Myxococcales bacterium]|nr:helix-turn-helix transcriptional regulator [Myxococcales bacterium]
PRQRQVFDLIVQGLSNAEIAARFDLSSDTVKYHLKTIFKLLDISSKSELLLLSRTVWGD